MPDLHEPPEWSDVAARITHESVRRVMVIGAADVGKSTFCHFLLRTARAGGRTAALLDTDVGQKTVGPPACVSLAEGNSSKLVFVGATDPVQGWRRVVDGARWLAHEVDSGLVIVNTSGLLAGPGRRLKADKIAAIQASRLIAIGGGSDLEHIIGDHPTAPVLCLARSPVARRKTDAARRARRQQAFRSYFVDAAMQVFARGLVPGTLHSQLQAGVLVNGSEPAVPQLPQVQRRWLTSDLRRGCASAEEGRGPARSRSGQQRGDGSSAGSGWASTIVNSTRNSHSVTMGCDTCEVVAWVSGERHIGPPPH
jgi:hypothetical protein